MVMSYAFIDVYVPQYILPWDTPYIGTVHINYSLEYCIALYIVRIVNESVKDFCIGAFRILYRRKCLQDSLQHHHWYRTILMGW